ERAVDEALAHIDAAALQQVFREGLQNLREDARLLPLLEPAMAGGIRREVRGQVLPAGSGLENPEDTVEDGSRVQGRTALAVSAPHRNRNQGLQKSPLRISKFHADYIGRSAGRTFRFSIPLLEPELAAAVARLVHANA